MMDRQDFDLRSRITEADKKRIPDGNRVYEINARFVATLRR